MLATIFMSPENRTISVNEINNIAHLSTARLGIFNPNLLRPIIEGRTTTLSPILSCLIIFMERKFRCLSCILQRIESSLFCLDNHEPVCHRLLE